MALNEQNPENADSKLNATTKLLGKNFRMTSKTDGYWLSCTALVSWHEKLFGTLGPSPFRLFSQETDAQFPFLKDEEAQSTEKDPENSRDPIKIQLKQRISLTLRWGCRKDHQKNIFPYQNKELLINPVDLIASNGLLPWSWTNQHGKSPGTSSSLTSWTGRHLTKVSHGKRFDLRQHPALLAKTYSDQAIGNLKTRNEKGRPVPDTQTENRFSLSNHQPGLIKGSSISFSHAEDQEATSNLTNLADKALPFFQRLPISWNQYGPNGDQKSSLQEIAWNFDILSTTGNWQIGNNSSGYSKLQASRILSGRNQANSKELFEKSSVTPNLQSSSNKETGDKQSPQWSRQEKEHVSGSLFDSLKTQGKNQGSTDFASRFAAGNSVIAIGKRLILKPWNLQNHSIGFETDFLKNDRKPENSRKSEVAGFNLPSRIRSLKLESTSSLGNRQKRSKDRISLSAIDASSGVENMESGKQKNNSVDSNFSFSAPAYAHKISFNSPENTALKLLDIFTFALVRNAQKREKDRLSKTNHHSGNSIFSSSPSRTQWSANSLKTGWLGLLGIHALSNGSNVETESQGERAVASIFPLSAPVQDNKIVFNSPGKPSSMLSGISTLAGPTNNGVKKRNDNPAQSSNKANLLPTEGKKRNGMLSLLKSNDRDERIRTTLIEPSKVPEDLSRLVRVTMRALVESQEKTTTNIENSNKESDLLIRKLIEQLSISQQNSRVDARALLQAVQTLNQQLKQADTGGLAQHGSRMRPLHFLGPL